MSNVATVTEARGVVADALRMGVDLNCMCCEQKVAKYKRSMSQKMVESLKLIASHKDGMMTRTIINEVRLKVGREQHMLKYWGFVEQDSKRRWHVTQRGHDFLKGKLSVPKYALVYNGKVLGFTGDQVSIKNY